MCVFARAKMFVAGELSPGEQMDKTEVYYFDQQWLHGPATVTEIAEMLAVGELDDNTPAWTLSGNEWIEASFFAKMAHLDDDATPAAAVAGVQVPFALRDMPPPREVYALRLAYDQHMITRQQADWCLKEILESPKLAYDMPGQLHRRGWITAGQRSNLACLAQGDGSQQFIAGYELLERLGNGSMGATYRARQVSLDREVALKVILPRYSHDPEYIKRFLREARVAAKLNHENIATVYEVGSSGDQYYIAMEMVRGKNLAQRLAAEGRIAEKDAVAIVCGVATALQYAYEQGIVHRDISTKNIMLSASGQPKLIDLGLAKNVDSLKSDESETALGTPAYLSPEQALGRANVDIRSDIYSLGCVFYEMLCGSPPFHGESALETIAMHLSRSIPEISIPGISAAVRKIIKKMTHRDLECRYQTPAEVVADLQNMEPSASDKGNEILPVGVQLEEWKGGSVSLTLRSDWREYLHLIAREIDHRLETEGVPPDFQGCVQTIFTELAANAFDHGIAGMEDGLVYLRIELNSAFFRLEVEDTGNGFASKEVLAELRRAPLNRERQRGLLQVMQIADILEYNKKGNRVKAVLYRKAEGSGVYLEQRDNVLFVEVKGKGDMALTEELRRWVDNFNVQPRAAVCLMVRTEWVCSMFVGAVAKLSGKIDENGGRLVVWVERSGCRRVMEQLGITTFVEIYSSFEKSVAALMGRQPTDSGQ